MSDPIKDKFIASLRDVLNEKHKSINIPEEPNINALADKVFGTKLGERMYQKFVGEGYITLKQSDAEDLASRFAKAMATEIADTVDKVTLANPLGYYPDARPRPSIDEWAMGLAAECQKRSSCLSRQVGCVLLDSMNHVIGMGYNGSARGMSQCTDDKTCMKRALGFRSGEGDEYCPAIHAEQNALVQCSDTYKINTVYVTTSPCHTCAKMLLSTSARKIVFLDEYTGLSGRCAKEMWLKAGREWVNFYGA